MSIMKNDGTVLKLGQFSATFHKIVLKGKYLQIFAEARVFDCSGTSFVGLYCFLIRTKM